MTATCSAPDFRSQNFTETGKTGEMSTDKLTATGGKNLPPHTILLYRRFVNIGCWIKAIASVVLLVKWMLSDFGFYVMFKIKKLLKTHWAWLSLLPSSFYKNEEDDAPIKRCPKCKVYIERDEGCAQMMCKNCKHAFCWYCLESLDVSWVFIKSLIFTDIRVYIYIKL